MATKNPNIYLIGGAPTVGKSTIAASLAQHLKLPWISTDQIRDLMRATVRREDYPDIFTPAGYDVTRFLTEFTAEQIVNMEMEQGKATWPGIKHFIEDSYPWENGFIIEGINILPHLVAQDYRQARHIKAVFLVDENADRMREVIFTRGLWGDADQYADDLKEKEVEWASLFSHRLKAEVEKYGYPWVEVKKDGTDLKIAMNALNIIPP